jgi:hypothetical protein
MLKYDIQNCEWPKAKYAWTLKPRVNIHRLLEQGQILHGLLDPRFVGVNKKPLAFEIT